ncbi:MAG: B12-binding domain-containing radical SAM protein [Candidatus Thorarchaeota archaeon]
MKTGLVDYVVLGEGERTIRELAFAIRDGREPIDIEGICYMKGNEIVTNPERPLLHHVDDVDIDWDCIDPNDYIEHNARTGKRTFRSYRSSRGCPFECTFCYNVYFNKRRFRPHSANYVLKDMEMLREKYKVDIVQFTDDNFFGNKKRAFDILRGMKKLGMTTTDLDVRATDVDEELMKTLVECDCRSVFVGLESENERVLKYMKKKIRKEDFMKALSIAEKFGIKVSTQMIIGIPTHTRKEIMDTIDFSVDMLKYHPTCNLILVPYLPLPGTVMFREAMCNGHIPPTNIEEYDNFGTPTGYLKPSASSMSWLHWATDQDREKLRLVAPISTQALFVRPTLKDKFPVRTVKKILFRIACFRLSQLFFSGVLDYHFSVALMKMYASRIQT